MNNYATLFLEAMMDIQTIPSISSFSILAEEAMTSTKLIVTPILRTCCSQAQYT